MVTILMYGKSHSVIQHVFQVPLSVGLERFHCDPHCLLSHTEHVVWSGIKLGPPRKLKFPESGKVVELVKEKMADLGLDK